MKFFIKRPVLLNSLLSVAHGLSSKTPLIVRTGIKIQAQHNLLILTSSNNEISVQVILENSSSLIVEEEGECVVPGKIFIEIVKKAEGEEIEFTLFEENTIKIISGRSNFTLATLEKNYFPTLNFDEIGEPISFDAIELKKMIMQTAFAAGTSENKIVLTGVCFSLHENKLNIVATDSYRLAMKICTIQNLKEDRQIIIPARSLDELKAILTDTKEAVKLYINNNKALFVFENTFFMTRLIEGVFPSTNSLFPKDYLVEIKFNKNELIDTIDRASLFNGNDNSNIVKMVLNSDKTVQISSNTTEIGRVVDEVQPLSCSSSINFQTAFNAKNFLDAVKAFEDNEINVRFTGEIKPFVINSSKETELTQLILPVRIF